MPDVGCGVGNIFFADSIDRGNGGWAEPEVVRALPVALVMLRMLAGLRVVRGLVMIEACSGENFLGEVVVVGIVVFAFLIGAVLEGIEKCRVLLIGKVIRGDVVGRE